MQGFHFAGWAGFYFHWNDPAPMLNDIIDFTESPPGSLPVKQLRVRGRSLCKTKLLPHKLFGQPPFVCKKKIPLFLALDGGQA